MYISPSSSEELPIPRVDMCLRIAFWMSFFTAPWFIFLNEQKQSHG